MNELEQAVAAESAPTPELDVLSLEAVDVTSTQEVAAEFQASLPAGAVASALASRMSLPENVPWTLHDSRGAVLADDKPIGEQLEPGARVTVAPKTHLG